jgi:hypothetical protein
VITAATICLLYHVPKSLKPLICPSLYPYPPAIHTEPDADSQPSLLLGSIDEFPEFIENDASDNPFASSSSSSQLPKPRSMYANAQNAHHPISSSSQAQNPYGMYEYDLPSLNLGAETPLSEYSASPSPGGLRVEEAE